MNEVNFELIAIKLGDAVKWERSVNEIERIARATLKITREGFSHENITSIRAQTVYDWIRSLEHSDIPLEEKIKRCSLFIEALEINPEVEEELKMLLGFKDDKKISIDEVLNKLEKLPLEPCLIDNLLNRLKEIENCIKSNAHLSAIIMMGSVLEGLLLAVISKYPEEANRSKFAPKGKNGKVKKFHEWKLTELISVTHDCGWIGVDVKDFSDQLRDYRNMIHPYHQISKGIYPDEDTAKICWEVLRAVINDLTKLTDINSP
ncbi:MAG: hypothetical protein GXO18_06915 [Aquificae bacterium]|nr:hypothetical protein [Aquificota bacterium]